MNSCYVDVNSSSSTKKFITYFVNNVLQFLFLPGRPPNWLGVLKRQQT